MVWPVWPCGHFKNMGGDRTNAERQRRYIARLKARAAAGVSNATDATLRQELAQAKQRIADLERRLQAQPKATPRVAMPFQTMAALAKALHPDHAPSKAEREAAFKLFTAWQADNKAKARKK